tara:strand:+ start:4632 stop:5255 length:624 start_codon:yes stop_codon:yes gene_type:complete
MFSPKNNKTSTSTNKYPEGVWFQQWTIEEITVNENNTYNQDINLIAHINNGILEYPKKFWLAGNHEKEQGVAIDYGTSKTVEKGGSYYIKMFIKATGVNPLTALNEKGDNFTDEAMSDLIGSSLFVCEFPTDGKYSEFWKTVASTTEGDNVLRQKWIAMFSDKEQHKYIPKKYKHRDSEMKKYTSEKYAPMDKHAAAFEAEDAGMPF